MELIMPPVWSADMGHESCGVLRFWSAAVSVKLKGQESGNSCPGRNEENPTKLMPSG